MMRTVFVYCLLLLVACKKSDSTAPTSDTTTITYEIETSVAGLSSVHYIDNSATPACASCVYAEWTVTGAGTFTKQAKIKHGTAAELSAMHANSNGWKIRIKNSAGQVLKEIATPALYQSGAYSYYYADALIQVP